MSRGCIYEQLRHSARNTAHFFLELTAIQHDDFHMQGGNADTKSQAQTGSSSRPSLDSPVWTVDSVPRKANAATPSKFELDVPASEELTAMLTLSVTPVVERLLQASPSCEQAAACLSSLCQQSTAVLTLSVIPVVKCCPQVSAWLTAQQMLG